MADLLIEVLRNYVRKGQIRVHDFVIMPDHVHILMTVPAEVSLEKAMQLIKGGFSFRAQREVGFRGEIWQRGYSDVQILDEESLAVTASTLNRILSRQDWLAARSGIRSVLHI